MLALILIYASIFSALPQVRGALEMTEMQAFSHWLFVAMIAVFMLALTTVTLFRIRWNMINAGVLTTHLGLLLLSWGAIWYFSVRVEGDVMLISPKIEIRSVSGASSGVLAQFPAHEGETWETFMPILGGDVRAEVVSVDREGGDGALRGVTVAVQQGANAEPEQVKLEVTGDSADAIAMFGPIALRLVTFEPQTQFYDREVAALYVAPANHTNDAWVFPLDTLPRFRERFSDDGEPVFDAANARVASKRTWPHMSLAGIDIPTSWFERWRMPIDLAMPSEAPFDLKITGYLPYIRGFRESIADGGSMLNPAAEVMLTVNKQKMQQVLFALDPVRSLRRELALEFRWVNSAAERDALFAPLAGPHELTVEITDPPVKETFAIAEGETIEAPGTDYVLDIVEIRRDWPLMSAGVEGAVSAVARVDVRKGEAPAFNRTVVERFPQFSQDVTAEGTRLRDGFVDDNIKLSYRDAGAGKMLLVAGPGLAPELGVFAASGAVQRLPLKVGKAVDLPIFKGARLELRNLVERGWMRGAPVVQPLAFRRPNVGLSVSCVRVQIEGRGPLQGWSESRWVVFSAYPHIQAQPEVVTPPGGGHAWEITYTRHPRDLGVALVPDQLVVNFHPGGRGEHSWRSDFYVRSNGEDQPAHVETNQTYVANNWTLFQSGAAQDDWSYTILGVGNRNGINLMLIGTILVTLGSMYAFYIKPILLRRKAAHGAARAAERKAARANAGVAPAAPTGAAASESEAVTGAR